MPPSLQFARILPVPQVNIINFVVIIIIVIIVIIVIRVIIVIIFTIFISSTLSSQSACKHAMGDNRISDGMICAFGDGKDTCQVVKIKRRF